MVLLLALVGGVRMPFGVPGAFAAVLAGALIFWLRAGLGGAGPPPPAVGIGLAVAIPWPTLAWIDALATVVTGFCGGVIQNTPYIGHPAYKAMGARAGYTLATALVIGVGASAGALGALVGVLPEAAVAPILVFIGLEITAQAFLASPPRHGAAVTAGAPLAVAAPLAGAYGVLAALALVAAAPARTR